MSVAEATKSMIDLLPESDVQVIYAVIKNIFYKETTPFKPLTRNQILSDLETSRKQVENGETSDFDSAIDRLEEKYGFYYEERRRRLL